MEKASDYARKKKRKLKSRGKLSLYKKERRWVGLKVGEKEFEVGEREQNVGNWQTLKLLFFF